MATVAFEITEEQNQLREMVRKFLDDKSDESAVRTLMATNHGYDRDVWQQMARELELQAVCIPSEYGGHGFGFVELSIILEEMGRALLCAPYFSSVVLAANAIWLSGDEKARKIWLPKIASGEIIATLALTEENGRLDVLGISMQARHLANDWVLDGTKMYVLDGHVADLIIVVAQTSKGLSLFSVDGESDGLKRSLMMTMDQTRKLAKLEFAGVKAKLIGVVGIGWDVVQQVLDLAAVALAAEQVGGAQHCLNMSSEYAKLRVQFGRPIGSFQAIKHKCADMLIDVEAAKSVAYYGAWCVDAKLDKLPRIAAIAKSYCSEVYFRTAAENIQIHGGIGFTWEHSAHLYFKRAKSSELMFGTPIYHRELLAEIIAESARGGNRAPDRSRLPSDEAKGANVLAVD